MKLVITGGGTAGHAYPAVHVGVTMREHYQAEVFFLGNREKIEKTLARNHHIPFYHVPSAGLQGNFLEKSLRFGALNGYGTMEAFWHLKKIKPDVVFASGGFTTAPVLAACRLLHIPYVLHEQNSKVGKVNQLFDKGASLRLYSFPIASKTGYMYSGNPVQYNEKLKKTGEKLVFLGGSNGSKRLNEEALQFAEKHPAMPVLLQTGLRYEQEARAFIDKKNLHNVSLVSFTKDMLDEVYAKAKVIVCRAGSGTLFEMANLGIPNILVPYPHASEEHQKKNAMFFAQTGASLLIEEDPFFHQHLEEAILELWFDKKRREEMKRELETLSKRDASAIIAEHLYAVHERKKG